MKPGRCWLALSYLLASLLVQGMHDHGRRADDAVLEATGGCDETRLHVASHEVVDLGESPTACPSCQLRVQPSLWSMAPQPLPGPGVAIPTEDRRPSTLSGSPLRTRCRAPPLA